MALASTQQTVADGRRFMLPLWLENQRKEEYNLETALLIEPDNEEAMLMMMKIAIEQSNYEKVKNLSDTFSKVCKNLCDENKDIQESLKNIEPENNES